MFKFTRLSAINFVVWYSKNLLFNMQKGTNEIYNVSKTKISCQSKTENSDSLNEGRILSLMLPKFALWVVALPFIGLSFSLLWSLFFDFERSTGTSCRVPNYLPSVSASIALTPQAYIWRFSIVIHWMPRLVMVYGYWVWYSQRLYDTNRHFFDSRYTLMFLTAGSNFVELVSLLGLTLISSRENRMIHEFCFVFFMIGCLICMMCSCLLYSMIVPKSDLMKISYRRKKRSFVVCLVAFIASGYFFFRHNMFCEPGVYTWFAICEYFIIASNLTFHFTITLDFENYRFSIQHAGEEKKK